MQAPRERLVRPGRGGESGAGTEAPDDGVVRTRSLPLSRAAFPSLTPTPQALLSRLSREEDIQLAYAAGGAWATTRLAVSGGESFASLLAEVQRERERAAEAVAPGGSPLATGGRGGRPSSALGDRVTVGFADDGEALAQVRRRGRAGVAEERRERWKSPPPEPPVRASLSARLSSAPGPL